VKNNYPTLNLQEAEFIAESVLGPLTTDQKNAVLLAASWPIKAVADPVTLEFYGYVKHVPAVTTALNEIASKIGATTIPGFRRVTFCAVTQRAREAIEVVLSARAEEAPRNF
jgi:hypothetical protein